MAEPSRLSQALEYLGGLDAAVAPKIRAVSDAIDPVNVARRAGLNLPTAEQLSIVPHFVGPGADIEGMVNDAREGNAAVSRGDMLGALGGYGSAAAAIPMMALPGTVAKVKDVITGAGTRLVRDMPGATAPLSAAKDFYPARGGGKIKHYEEATKNLGLVLPPEDLAKLRDDHLAIEALRRDRAESKNMAAALSNYPEDWGQTRLAKKLAVKRWADERPAKDAMEAARRQSQMDAIQSYADQGLWRKDFAEMALRDAKHDFGVDSAIKANMEATPRVLSKEGWTMRHASAGRDGRKSSRYLVSPDGKYEVRLSDHYLPDTPQRAERGGATRWNDEFVLSGKESPQEVIDSIKKMFSEWGME